MKSSNALFRTLLARRTGLAPSAIQPWHHLEQDLGLTPLGRVLVALDAEETSEIRVPVETLAEARTAGQLMALLDPKAPPADRLASMKERAYTRRLGRRACGPGIV